LGAGITTHNPPQIEVSEFSILCWFNWYDGPLSGLLSWHYKLYWFQYVDRWGVDEEKDIWEEDWGYIYEVYELTNAQMEEAVNWFKEKGDWFHNKRFKNEGIELRDWDGPQLPKTGIAMFTDKSGLRGGGEGDFALPQDFKLAGRDKQVHVFEQEILTFLKQIETGEVTLVPLLDPQVHIKSDILYKASNGWSIEISNWSGQFSGIVEIILPNGEVLDVDFLDTHMQNVCLYFPDPEVEWLAYRMKNNNRIS